MKHARVTSASLFAAGLALVLIGQCYLAYRRDYAWDGAIFWVLGLALLALSTRRRTTDLGAASDGRPARGGLRHPSWRCIAAGSGALLSVLAGLMARHRGSQGGYVGPLVLWLSGVALYVLAHSPLPRIGSISRRARQLNDDPPRAWGRALRLLGLATLVLAALAVRAVNLDHAPRNLGGDEGTFGMEGLAMLSETGLANPFATRWFSVPSMSFMAYGLSMRVFGESVAGLRTLSALLGAGAVVTTFGLARELWGRRVAWFAAVALAFGHYHLHFSRLGVNHVADALLVTLCLWLLLRGFRLGRTTYFAWAGAVIGIGWYAYFGSRLIGIIVAIYVATLVVVEREVVSRHRRDLMILVGASLVVAAPLVLYFARHPMSLIERTNQVSILTSGWLAQEQTASGMSTFALLLRQVWRSISAFNYTLDPTFWYHADIPLLDFASGALFALGVIWASTRARQRRTILLLIWFWLAVFAGWVLTENPPSSQRLPIVAPAAAILVALGLDWITHLGRRAVGGSQRLWTGIASILLALIVLTNMHYYFAVYTPSRVYGNPTAETTTVLGRHLARRNDDAVVYFYGAPFIYWDFGTLRFLTRGVAGVNVPPMGEGDSVEPDVTRDMCFVFIPERLAEMDRVKGAYPGGTEMSVSSDVNGRLLYVIYRAPAPLG